MSDETLFSMDLADGPDRQIDATVHYTFTPQQQAAREDIIALIDAEKAAYYARVEPLLKRLEAIRGTPHVVIRNGLR